MHDNIVKDKYKVMKDFKTVFNIRLFICQELKKNLTWLTIKSLHTVEK